MNALLWLLLPLLGVWGLLRACRAAALTDWGPSWLNTLDGFVRLYCRYYHRYTAEPVPLPATGAALLAANHLSGLDPLLMVAACRRPLRFLIAQEEYERPWLKPLFNAVGCIPVDRNSRPEVALRAALRALQAGEVVALFPQGRITLPDEPRRPLKRGIHWLAQQANCAIYPVHLSGIQGLGQTLPALLWRSHARLLAHPALDCDEQPANCLQDLQELLENPAR